MATFDIYAEVTDRIVGMLEKGVVPWRSPIMAASTGGWPKNFHTGKPYRGVNVFLLAFTAWSQGYASPHWITFKQAQQRGGKVKKGEKASMVVFWKMYQTRDKETGEPTTVPVLRYYMVFNLGQCEGIALTETPKTQAVAFNPITAAEQIVAGFEGRPEIEHRGTRAYYFPAADSVHVPPTAMFTSPEAYYATLFHELAHSTGHSTRLDRGIDTVPASFGSAEYAKEELVAEMAAAFLCGHTGILPQTIDNAASYISGWIGRLKGDKRLAVTAAGAAQKAADWIMGRRGNGEPENVGEVEGAEPVSAE